MAGLPQQGKYWLFSKFENLGKKKNGTSKDTQSVVYCLDLHTGCSFPSDLSKNKFYIFPQGNYSNLETGRTQVWFTMAKHNLVWEWFGFFSDFIFSLGESWLHSLSFRMMEFYRNSIIGNPVIMVWSTGTKVLENWPHENGLCQYTELRNPSFLHPGHSCSLKFGNEKISCQISNIRRQFRWAKTGTYQRRI